MIKLTCLLKRKEGMTPAEFQRLLAGAPRPADRHQQMRAAT